ncbi:hypothetical protein AB1L42_21870 [Thalassoglobus sp. JC818]|uniref:hypothetical protein n=1 Tax=Thalassoglobus sp. JC818 TaxID=3232136 RepID=UPI003457A390
MTTEKVSGKVLWAGSGTRVNNAIFVLTMNSPQFATDISQRSVIIKMGNARKSYSESWDSEVIQFMKQHRTEILGGLRTFLEIGMKDRQKIEESSRWGRWEGDVLSKLTRCNDAQLLIKQRRGEVDAEASHNDDMVTAVDSFLSKIGYDVGQDSIFIPSRLVAHIMSIEGRQRVDTKTAGTMFNQLINESDEYSKQFEYPENPINYDGGKSRGFIRLGADDDVQKNIMKRFERADLDGFDKFERGW